MKGKIFAAALAASMLVAAPARAVTTAIPGNPLTVYVSDRGQLQAVRTGDQGGIFYPSTSPEGDAGFFLAFPAMTGQNGTLIGRVYGFNGVAGPNSVYNYATVAQGVLGGAGTAGSPYSLETTYKVATLATVKQTTTYVNGAQEFRVHWDVTNDSGAPLPFKALAAADFYFEGSDVGSGIFSEGPPRFVGGTNSNTGRSGGFIESTPWDAWQALSYDSPYNTDRVWDDVIENAATSTAHSFDDTIETRMTDNAGGVEWDGALTSPLASHDTRSFELLVRSAVPAALQFDRTTAGAVQGTPLTFVATARDTSGQPFTGKALRYTIMGPNATSGAVTIDGAGNAAITDPGRSPGSDTISAYVDLNGNSTRDAGEPQAGVTAVLSALPDRSGPVCKPAIGSARPGAGKPILVTVKCNGAANLSVTGSLTFTVKKKHGKARKVVAKAVATKLQTLVAGQAEKAVLRVSPSVAKRYAGAKALVNVTVTATDAAGNRAVTSASRTLKLAPAKKKKHRR